MADTPAAGAIAPAASEVQTESQATESQESAPELPPFKGTKHKLKVNGKEQELDYDEIIKLAQKNSAGDEKLRNAAEKEKQVVAKEKQLNELLDKWKRGDLAELERLIDNDLLDKYSEQRLLKKLELEQMSPDARGRLAAEEKAKKLEGEIKTREEREQNEKYQVMQRDAAREIDTKMKEAFDAHGLSMTPMTLEAAAQFMMASLETTGTLMDPAKAVVKLRQNAVATFAEIARTMPRDELLKSLPKEILDAIRKADVATAREQDPMRGRAPQTATKLPLGKNKRMSTDDFFNKLETKFGR